MKITVICKTNEWQVEQLKEAAPKHGVTIDVRDITEPGNILEDLGDVVLWRSSSLGGGQTRFDMMNVILQKHVLINRCLAVLPQATEKAFQQTYIQEKAPSVRCIPTFTFRSVEEIELAIQDGKLRYPFIQKPNKGSKGEGVELIKNPDNLYRVAKDIDRQVYQNFIKNSGDYRAFILGGRMLGAIKRTAQDGGFLNNISKGGSAEAITDPKVLAKLRRIGTTVASVFELTLCGVDIIYDEISHEYFFLEVNTVPQWKGFQEATGINVADEIIRYCKRLINRGSLTTPALVSEEYQSQLHILGDKQFHFLSRMYLWTGASSLKEALDLLREKYISSSAESMRVRLREIYARVPEHGDRMVAKEARQVYFKKYPNLEPSLNLLFKNLFVREIYKEDISTYIRDIVSDTDLLNLKSALENNHDALRTLSTHAINYLYTLDSYLGTKESATNPKKYFEIGTSYPEESFELQIYFLTHCIIGASGFYSTEIRKAELPIYIQMLAFIEGIIKNHFTVISLDNKFEFLVCAKICGYESSLEKDILLEADQSLSPDGNFLIDTHNTKAAPDERNDFVGAEHRNVLYIMSQTPFHQHII
jgi:RimK family alpha-L-glutamate ligase